MSRINTARFLSVFLFLVCLPLSANLLAANIHVAVASNFSTTMVEIASRFENSTKHKVTLISGSTGKHYAQIKNAAPFDIFFAADAYRPQRLENEEKIIAGSRFTYAIGRLVLWSPAAGYIGRNTDVLSQIHSGKLKFRRMAIANPRLAPYGKAAKEVLLKYGLWKQLSGRLVRGENINQTFQFVKSRNAQLGFVAYSQVKHVVQTTKGTYWLVPQSDYQPIIQQAVLLTNTEATHSFIRFVKSKKILQLIRDNGYDTP